ncbi:hypothetical protein Daus18300_012881 [Diaporthe australafricana]|uniref:C2H2-type domain-containing protein n=1 Tax=Diaporthe australafricana TaxID=127596 RepID=A0ABR3W144_9PEZI
MVGKKREPRNHGFLIADKNALVEFENFANGTSSDIRIVSKGKKAQRERVLRTWKEFHEEFYPDVDPDQVWVDLCLDKDDAKARIKIFLQYYIKSSGRWEVCLGPEEYSWQREITSAISVTEAWKCMVCEAHATVLYEKRRAHPLQRALWALAFKERDKTGPVAEISRWIAGPLSTQFNLVTEQIMLKQEATAEDIALFLDTLWSRAPYISLTPNTRLAFHTYVLLAALGGFRPGSILNLPWKRVEFGLVRDPLQPKCIRLNAHVLVIHNKRRAGTLKRTQDDKVNFTVTLVPCPTFCLVSFLAARALAEDLFEAGYRTIDELLNRPFMEKHINYIPLPLKESAKTKRAIPLGQEKLNEICNRVVLCSGVRQSMRPYSLRVGAGGRLDGALTPALRNYVLSNSSVVFQKSYQPQHLGEDLARIAFSDQTAFQGQDELFTLLKNSTLTQDHNAPVEVSLEDTKAWETRKDITEARSQLKTETDPKIRNNISHKISRIIHSLEKLRILELREQYFGEVDRRRGLGLPTDDLHLPPPVADVPATRVGRFLARSDELKQVDELMRTRQFITLLVDFYQNNLSSGSDDLRVNEPPSPDMLYPLMSAPGRRSPGTTKKPGLPVCLLCGDTFFNRPSLTRYHARRHLEDDFQKPFPCPECLRDGRRGAPLIENTDAWSNHVELYHGRANAPRALPARMIWHTGADGGEIAYCMLCGKDGLQPGKGFSRHVSAHKKHGLFDKATKCRGCSQILDPGHEAWMVHMWEVHEAWPTNGALLRKFGDPGPAQVPPKKRARTEDMHTGNDSDSDALSVWSDARVDSLLRSSEPCEDPSWPKESHAPRSPRRKRLRVEPEVNPIRTRFVKSRSRSLSPPPLDSITCAPLGTEIPIDPALWETGL